MIIYGASGHGKVICYIIRETDLFNNLCFVDDFNKGKTFYNYKLFHTSKINLSEEILVIAIGNNSIRQKIASRYTKFHTAIHTTSTISDSVAVGKGTVIMANVVINADSCIGNHVILNTSCSIDHDCEIDDFAHISPNASLAGNVKVEEGAHIGIGASVIQGIKIGKFATVGAGSVVINNVPAGVTVVGCPAKEVSHD